MTYQVTDLGKAYMVVTLAYGLHRGESLAEILNVDGGVVLPEGSLLFELVEIARAAKVVCGTLVIPDPPEWLPPALSAMHAEMQTRTLH